MSYLCILLCAFVYNYFYSNVSRNFRSETGALTSLMAFFPPQVGNSEYSTKFCMLTRILKAIHVKDNIFWIRFSGKDSENDIILS
jgi:hypothetical protein